LVNKLNSIKDGIEEEIGDEFAKTKLIEMMNFLIKN